MESTLFFWLRALAALAAAMIFNSVVGTQVQYPALSSKGLFRDACRSNETTCAEQESTFERTLNFQLALGAAVPLATVADVLGGYWSAVLLAGTWMCGNAVSGVAAGNGWWWTVGQSVAGVAGINSINLLELFHCEWISEGDESRVAILRSGMALATILGLAWAVVVAEFLGWEGLSFPVAFACYGGIVGGAMLGYELLGFGKHRQPPAVGEDGASPSETDPLTAGGDFAEEACQPAQESATPSFRNRIVAEMAAAARICATPAYFALVMGQIIRCVFYLFFLSHVGILARHAGVSGDQAHMRRLRLFVNVVLVGASVPSLMLGWCYGRFGPRGWAAISVGAIPFFVAGGALLASVKGELWAFYTAFGCLGLARSFINANLAVTFPVIFEGRRGQSAAYTMVWSVGGIAGMIASSFLSRFVHSSDSAGATVAWAFVAAGTATQLGAALSQFVWVRTRSNNVGATDTLQ